MRGPLLQCNRERSPICLDHPVHAHAAQSRRPRPIQDAAVQPVMAAIRAERSILIGETFVCGQSGHAIAHKKAKPTAITLDNPVKVARFSERSCVSPMSAGFGGRTDLALAQISVPAP